MYFVKIQRYLFAKISGGNIETFPCLVLTRLNLKHMSFEWFILEDRTDGEELQVPCVVEEGGTDTFTGA